MTVLCDYTVVHAGRVVIGNGSNPTTSAANPIVFAQSGPFRGPRFSKKFNTDGREDAQALLMINVEALTDGKAVVMVNGEIVNPLTQCPQANVTQTFTQHMVLPSDLLSPTGGNNRLEIMRVPEAGGTIDQFDDFAVRDIVIFFKQKSA